MIKLKVTTVGSSAGIVLPKEALALLKVAKGDSVFLTESPGGLRITPYSPEFEEQMALARNFMRERRDVRGSSQSEPGRMALGIRGCRSGNS